MPYTGPEKLLTTIIADFALTLPQLQVAITTDKVIYGSYPHFVSVILS